MPFDISSFAIPAPTFLDSLLKKGAFPKAPTTTTTTGLLFVKYLQHGLLDYRNFGYVPLLPPSSEHTRDLNLDSEYYKSIKNK
jgi:hypothetical protein